MHPVLCLGGEALHLKQRGQQLRVRTGERGPGGEAEHHGIRRLYASGAHCFLAQGVLEDLHAGEVEKGVLGREGPQKSEASVD